MEQNFSDNHPHQHSKSNSSTEEDETRKVSDNSEVASSRDFLGGIGARSEEDISVAYERVTLGRPRTDWTGLCWDPELVQRNSDSDNPPQSAGQQGTPPPTAPSTEGETRFEDAKPAQEAKRQDKSKERVKTGKTSPTIEGGIEEANKLADEEEENFADHSNQSD